MLIERANAKINLFLDVLSKRENGYHNIASLMHSVSLCDLVSIDFRPERHTAIRMEASGNPLMPTDCRNLAWRAAEKFLLETGMTGKVTIRIEKHIPMAAGLAGGSTDAAAVLRGLNRLAGEPLSLEDLCRVGATLGADVPFCVLGGAALVEGIGERMTPMPPMPSCPMVVACMGEGVSTPWAYGELDRRYAEFTPPRAVSSRANALLDALKEGNVEGILENGFNLFAPVVEEMRPAVLACKSRMYEHGARFAMMSGSGPSVFGVFSTVEEADAACRALTAAGASAFVCHPAGPARK